MGDIAEYYMDQMMSADAELEAIRYHERSYVDRIEKEYMMGSLKWKAQFDGDVLVSKMAGNHIINTIDFLGVKKGKSERRDKWLEIFNIEIEKRTN